jgi:GT2 family glycosyltransferase
MISIVICSVDDARFRAVSRNYADVLRGEPHELIRIRDAKGLCEGYNRGFAQSKGDIVIFCHDDIEILNVDFNSRLHKHLERFDVIGVAGTTRMMGGGWTIAGLPYLYGQVAHPGQEPGTFTVVIYSAPSRAVTGIQGMDGVFLAARRNVVQQIGFDEKTFDGFHCYDADFTFRAHLAGFRLAVCCDINIFHASVGELNEGWQKAMLAFENKFEDRLCPLLARHRTYAEAIVATRQEIVEAMNPPHWGAD